MGEAMMIRDEDVGRIGGVEEFVPLRAQLHETGALLDYLHERRIAGGGHRVEAPSMCCPRTTVSRNGARE